VGVSNDEEEFITRTSGAVLGRSVRIPNKDLGHNGTHIRTMCGGIGGRAAMMGIETGAQVSRTWQLKKTGISS